MADVNVLNSSKNEFFIGTQNDVVSSQQHTIMVTDEPSDGNNSTINNNVIVEQMDNCGAVGVSALSLNENEKISIVLPATIMTVDNNNAIHTHHSSCMAAGKLRGKRRRRKTKSKCNGGGNGGGGGTGVGGIGGGTNIGSNGKPYRKSNWKFQMPRSSRRQGDEVILSTLVPYNTNKFLMEEHMPEYSMGNNSPTSAAAQHVCRNRDSSFSYDSADENNYFPEDEEEFLTKEFKSVYEDARTERLDGMSKAQLIHEYLQLEANYDKLSNNLDRRKCEDEREVELANNESRSVIMKQDERIKELLAENLGKFFSL